MTTSSHSEYGSLSRVMVNHPRDAFFTEELIDKQWRQLNYRNKPDLDLALNEFDAFIGIIESNGVDVEYLNANGLDSLYVRDASIVTDKGIILCNMGKKDRKSEPAMQKEFFKKNGYNILGEITGKGTLEGGDVAWLDGETLAVGRGYRTNAGGITQLQRLLSDFADIIEVPLPHYKGPSDVFHLMSILSPVDKDLAVVYSPLMPVQFREELIGRGMELVEVPYAEFDKKGCNVLAIAPRVCLMVKGNPITRSRLEEAGAIVIEYEGQEICHKGDGGPTCLTRPLIRRI